MITVSKKATLLLVLIFMAKLGSAQNKPGSLFDRFMNSKMMQSKLVQRFTSSEKDTTRSPGFILLPAFSYGPETGLVYGIQGVYNFYLDKEDLSIRTSNINVQSTFSTERQSNSKITADIWSKNNLNHYTGELRYRNFPFYFFGLGSGTLDVDRGLITQKMARIRFDYERKLLRNYYVGLRSMFEHYAYLSNEEDGGIYNNMPLFGRSGGRYMTIGISQSYDSRNNINYTTKGYLARGTYSYAPNLWGGENFSGSIANLNLRAFFPMTSMLTLALNATYDEVFGRVPFYLLPQLGSDEVMRGYYQGRYRDRKLLTSQAELRYRFHPRIGAVVFAGTGSVYNRGINLGDLKPSFGGGLRYFFDIEHNTSLRLDYGIGERRPGEPRQASFYISLGEAF